MKHIALVLLAATIFWSCGAPEKEQSEPAGEHSEQPEAEAHENEHHHGHDANAHMHQTDFDELVAHFDDPARAEWQKPEAVIEMLGALDGKTVADIGAGSGYFVFPMAEQAEKVIALDIDKRFVELLNARAAEKSLTNVEARLVNEDAPGLAEAEVNAAIIVNTYHHIHNRETYFAEVRKGLTPGGLLLVVDYKKEETPHGPPQKMRLPAEAVAQELEAAGYTIQQIDADVLPYQYMVLAEAP